MTYNFELKNNESLLSVIAYCLLVLHIVLQRELIEYDCILFAGIGCSVIVLLRNSMRFLRLSQ